MLRSICYDKNGSLRTDLSQMDIAFALQDPQNLLWVDFQETPPEEDEPILRKTFGFHPLAIDDALQESNVPKLDDWGTYLYIVLHAISLDPQTAGGIHISELDVFLGGNYLVTHHDQKIEALDHTWASVQRDNRHLKNGADYLLHRLIDDLVSSYLPVIEGLDVMIDRAEDEIFDRPTTETLEVIFTLKRTVLHLRRIIGPQREVLNKLARDNYAVIDPLARVYFRDIYDHMVRLYDISESIRDLVGGALDTYLSAVNNRMNEIMKTLTLITTLFMPISFIASFFGMNFFQPVAHLERWTNAPAFLLTLLIIVATSLGMYAWMRRRGWM
jgi:magnesium transporter